MPAARESPDKPPSMRPQEKDEPRDDTHLLERARPRPPEKISDIFFGPNPAEPRATADAAPSIKAHATI